MNRRQFVATTAGLALAASVRPVVAADAEVIIGTEESEPIVDPHIFGHFIEHIGGVIYDGIWVGRDSKIANIGGIRKSFLDDMNRINVPNIRWPGGCFADGYHWRDGIGVPEDRPRTYNFWRREQPTDIDSTETNAFGIHEFINLCKLTNSEPYVAANMGSSTPQEFYDWVSYCNAPTGMLSLADERASNGSPEPFNVRYWGVGNESWGCGGDMTAREYAQKYRQWVTQIPGYVRPFLVAAGPEGHQRGEISDTITLSDIATAETDLQLDWTRGFFEGIDNGHAASARVDGFALHFYSFFRVLFSGHNFKCEDFDAAGWYTVMHEGLRIEDVITKHWETMQQYKSAQKTKFVLDEWGNWYQDGPLSGPGHLFSQPITLRDGVHTALTFDIFNRHCEKLAMANVAQTINCIHSLFLAHGDNFVRTPVYYAFELYMSHMGARRVPLAMNVDDITVPVLSASTPDGSQSSDPMKTISRKMAGLSGSASIRDKRLAVSLTNPSLDHTVSVRLRMGDSSRVVREARAQVLTHEDTRAGNTFDNPGEVGLQPLQVETETTVVSVTLPKHSVATIELELA